ncbi:hypothetical protein QNO07_02790 [Streptomyces sp. 549]|uniref:hypothetical protein n=1 Tax=Streptomyces sp. 549 TaxID=3049076 RepID=UPI0024C2F4CD|nr:hypothetical protein [Streptomyces sp. 549]MDK1472361.1 hypothetical protein [Streptomyces sp. 549]
MRGLTAAAAVVLVLLPVAALTACGSGAGIRVETPAAASDPPQSRPSPLPADPLPSPEPDVTGRSGGATEGPSDGPGAADGTAEPELSDAGRLPTAGAPVSPPGAREALDVVALLRSTRAVGGMVREDLRPCDAESWPVDVAYGRLTGGRAADLVVNVYTCADGRGVGSYVFRQNARGTYVNVFADEEPAVYAEIDKGALRVYQEIFLKDDPACCPSGEDVVTYVWRDGGFAELDRTYQEYPQPSETAPGDGSDSREG